MEEKFCSTNVEKREIVWINLCKGFAIIAVMVDHLHGVIYNSNLIQVFSFFSVSVFIILAGVTSYISNNRNRNEEMYHGIKKRLIKFCVSYCVATFFYQIFEYDFWDLKTYLFHLLNFNITGPFYFVIFYMQLLIISPVFQKIIILTRKFHGRSSFLIHTFTIALISGISVLCLKYTFILEVHGGGKYLFGGTYLLLYYFGMLFAEKQSLVEAIYAKKAALVLVAVVWISMLLLLSNKLGEQLEVLSINPPGLIIIIYSILQILIQRHI